MLLERIELDRPTIKPCLGTDIFKIINRLGVNSTEITPDLIEIPLYQKILEFIEKNQKLLFILPAFPAKSANRDKTQGAAPDLGELLGLQALDQMCAEISKRYLPGAEVLICSDGRVFNDLVMVSDEELEVYKTSISQIIAMEGLSHLRTFSLDDCFDHEDFEKMRSELVENFAEPIDSIRERVKTDEEFRRLFNGIHRFIKEDLSNLETDLGKNQLMKKSKAVAYQVIQRSGAWDGILSQHFAEGLRLSIHPYRQTHRKFGVKLVSSTDRWATPWHNVTVKTENGFELMKRKEALERGGRLKFWNSRYAYYEL